MFINLYSGAKPLKKDISFIVTTTTNVPIESTTTTSSTILTSTSTSIKPRNTTTVKPKPSTTVAKTVNKANSVNGPPRNTTTLVGCIAYYESTWGKDPNVFQFTQGTWRSYGGEGSPEKASYQRQEEVFWLAWKDNGKHHWAAQKGRCF